MKEETKKIPLKCFVMMSSGKNEEYDDGQRESDYIYNHIIAPSVEEACGGNVDIVREADSSAPGAIDRRIVEHIASADIAIVDITGHNANVFLELGMRYALKRSTTILLRQSDTTIPFDIKSYRCVEYDPKWEGADRAKRDIMNILRTALANPTADSLVFNVYPNLVVDLDPSENDKRTERMPWDNYMKQLSNIQSLLRETIDDGRYKPDAILGLSNGGMVVADLLGRRLFRGTPIATFWVNRWSKGDWFNHPLNSAVIDGIKTMSEKNDNLELLVVDDIVASGTTIQGALYYISKSLENVSVRFLPIFSANEQYYELIQDHLIWLHPAFSNLDKDGLDITTVHSTSYRKLPYDKDIRSS